MRRALELIVVRAALANGFKPDSITSATPMRRPVGLAVGPDGSLYVADDASGRIWRVIYTGK